MKKIILLLFLSSMAFSQSKNIKGDVYQVLDFKYKETWHYFKLDDTISVTIIKHFPAAFHCGTGTSASLTIVKTVSGDTIRILDMCNLSNNYKKNKIVKIISGDQPNSKVSLPFTQIKNKETQKYVPSVFDLKVLKTAWITFLD